MSVSQAVVSAACYLACIAHAGQVDKAGRPYVLHVMRVTDAVRGDPLAEAVAYLHDVLEDSPKHTERVENEFPLEVVWRVWALTRKACQSDADYYAEIKADPACLRVKLADIADNADESRLALLDAKTADRLRRKYAIAREALA